MAELNSEPVDGWICYAPMAEIHLEDIEFFKSVHIFDDMQIRSTPDWIKERNFEPKSESLASSLVESQYVIECRYQAEAIGEMVTTNGNKVSKRSLVAERILLFNTAAWLCSEPLCCFASGVFHFEIDKDRRVLRSESENHEKVALYQGEEYFPLKAAHLETLKPIWNTLITLKYNSSPWIATWMIHKALYERHSFIKLLLVWIALEALFNPLDYQNQLTYQLCERIALFLKGATPDGQKLFSELKSSYKIRCSVAHGGMIKSYGQEGIKNLNFISNVCRSSITKIITSKILLSKFTGQETRENFLKSLAFGGESIEEA